MKPALILNLIAIILAANISLAAEESKSAASGIKESFVPQVWVSQHFEGPPQCRPSVENSNKATASGDKPVEPLPDNSKALIDREEQKFAQEKIKILKRETDELPVCEACGCPKYDATIRLLIKKQDLKKAEALGYTN